MERGLSILWIDAICGSVQNSMTPPPKERGPSSARLTRSASLRSPNGAAIGRYSRIKKGLEELLPGVVDRGVGLDVGLGSAAAKRSAISCTASWSEEYFQLYNKTSPTAELPAAHPPPCQDGIPLYPR